MTEVDYSATADAIIALTTAMAKAATPIGEGRPSPLVQDIHVSFVAAPATPSPASAAVARSIQRDGRGVRVEAQLKTAMGELIAFAICLAS